MQVIGYIHITADGDDGNEPRNRTVFFFSVSDSRETQYSTAIFLYFKCLVISWEEVTCSAETEGICRHGYDNKHAVKIMKGVFKHDDGNVCRF